jgi:hypothetical protein
MYLDGPGQCSIAGDSCYGGGAPGGGWAYVALGFFDNSEWGYWGSWGIYFYFGGMGEEGSSDDSTSGAASNCVLNLTISGVAGTPAFGAIGLANYLNQIFSPVDVQVSINSGAAADYTFTDASGVLAQIVAPSEALIPGSYGYTSNWGGIAFNSGYIFSDRTSAMADATGGSFSVAYDRIAAHELSHFLLQTPDLPFPGQGILSYGPDSGNTNTNRYLPTKDQLQVIKKKCQQLHPGGN